MSYKVAIRKNETGEVRICTIETDWAWRDALGEYDAHYLWSEGNNACDCNRCLTFERAGGREPADDECNCGETGYSCLYAELPDGTRVEIDGE